MDGWVVGWMMVWVGGCLIERVDVRSIRRVWMLLIRPKKSKKPVSSDI